MSANTSTTELESNHLHFPLFTSNRNVKVAIREGPRASPGQKAPKASGPFMKSTTENGVAFMCLAGKVLQCSERVGELWASALTTRTVRR